MKIRNGFVSNSSSSSFVVTHKPVVLGNKNPKRLLKDSEIKKLKKYGFTSNGFDYTYSVSCNQDDVIEFLLKEKIPFKAECHYGHYNVFYDRNKDEVIVANNFGCEMDTYGPYDILEMYSCMTRKLKPYEIFTRLKYLKEIKI